MKLPAGFYRRPTLEVAADLIGKVLVRRLKSGRAAGRIVETEAYIGTEDHACHAFRGRTPRTAVMFGPPGRSYVYMIYGFHHCLNAVTEDEGFPAAVLIRAIEPLEGLDAMKDNRPTARRVEDLGSGPGKLCQALGIDRDLNDFSLSGPTLWIEDRGIPAGPVISTPRIGVEYAGKDTLNPWRFVEEGNPHVSKARLPKKEPAKRRRKS